jgi:gamma-glutamyl phosphate reductase
MDSTSINLQWKEAALKASRSLNLISDDTINQILVELAIETVEQTEYLLSENAKDLAIMDSINPMYDRLLLSKERIKGIAGDIHNVARLPSPLGRTLMETKTRRIPQERYKRQTLNLKENTRSKYTRRSSIIRFIERITSISNKKA